MLFNCKPHITIQCTFPVQLYFCLIGILLFFSASAQNCPPNIDFENGTFSGWTCYTGVTQAVDTQNVISFDYSGGPVLGRHTMYSASFNAVDEYGGFPVSSPNGSGHSVKLGSTQAGGQAEGISYEFTIPPNNNSYSLTYYYAVVFQAPHHRPNEQPRMETEVTNLTDNQVISCASFSFIAVGSTIPGFEISNFSDTIDVLYKKWSAVSVDLSGNAGKRIRLFFKTADCTFRRHFGYAYIDVNSDCSTSFSGATYCPDDTVVHIVAPYGYEHYSWYDSSLSRLISTQQTLVIPPPPSGTMLAVKLEPYEGYGCPKTLFSRVSDSLTVIANAGQNGLACRGDTLQLGEPPKQGLVYSWSPPAGLSDPHIANPFVQQGVNEKYTLLVTNSGGGCRSKDSVQVTSSLINNLLQLKGKDAFCFGHGDSAVLEVGPEFRIQWYRDDVLLNSNANRSSIRVNQSGNYYALLTDTLGCSTPTPKKMIQVDHDKAGIQYPLKYAVKDMPLQLNARPIGLNALWTPASNLNTAASFEPVFKGINEQLYKVVISSQGGCITIDTQLVKVVEHVEIYVPTAFSPDHDGRNDYLHPVLRGVASIKTFRIFNRQGQQLFESNAELPGWDGSFKGWPLPSQAVVWILDCIGLDGVEYTRKGSSILVR